MFLYLFLVILRMERISFGVNEGICWEFWLEIFSLLISKGRKIFQEEETKVKSSEKNLRESLKNLSTI